MSYTETVFCDLCNKKITETKNLKRKAIWISCFGQESKYSLELTNKKNSKKLDLCFSCYKKCLKKIDWKEKK